MKERGNQKLRFIDRYFGIVLILFLSLFKRKRALPQEIDSIALFKSAGIGDLVLLSAIIQDLRRAYPEASIVLFTGSSNVEMGKIITRELSRVEVVSLPITNPFKTLKILRRRPISVFLEFDVWPRISPLLAYFSKAQFTIGHRTDHQYRHYLYDKALPHSHFCHELENFRKLLIPLAIVPESNPTIPIKAKNKKHRVHLHPFAWGAKGHLRQWQDEKWREVIDFLLKHHFEVYLTGSPREKEALDKIIGDKKEAVNTAGKFNLSQSAELLAEAKALVSVDTGIMHLGAALGIPVIALHGPSRFYRWGAIGKSVRIVAPQMNYTPCLSLGFEGSCKTNWCMRAITASEVIVALSEVLEIDSKPRKNLLRSHINHLEGAYP